MMTASIHVGCAQVSLAHDELVEAEQRARAALEVATVDHLPIAAVDALDLLVAVSERRGLATSMGEAAATERRRHDVRFGFFYRRPKRRTIRRKTAGAVGGLRQK